MNYKDDFTQENEQNETNSIDLTMPASSQNESNAEVPNFDQESNTQDFDRSSYETQKTQETNNREYTAASHVVEATRANEKPKGSKKSNLKGFASTLAAGVIGSVITLTILPHTDYMKNYFENADNQSAAATEVKPVTAQPTVAKTSGSSIADTVEKVSKAIVGIENYQKQQNSDFFGNSSPSQSVETGSGSGVIFQKNNNYAYIVTNNHVVEGASKLEISLYNGEKTKAEVVGTDALTDLAVLKIDAKYVNAMASFGDSSTLRPGDQVYAIGNPLGLDLSRTVTQGIISATNRSISVDTSAGSWDTNVIQTDAAINPGNSGGALINSQGQVIGINSLKISENGVEGLGFAIPSNDAIPIVNQLIKNGKIERPYIGIGLEDLDQIPQIYWQNLPRGVQKGVMITQVDPHSAASSSGLEVKDVIVSMNGTKIGTASELRKYLYTKVKVGDTVKFGVYRNGKLSTINVQLSK